MDPSASTEEPPPSPPSDHGDRVDGEPVEPIPEETKPPTPKPRRVVTQKQLENLKKARAAKASKRATSGGKATPHQEKDLSKQTLLAVKRSDSEFTVF